MSILNMLLIYNDHKMFSVTDKGLNNFLFCMFFNNYRGACTVRSTPLVLCPKMYFNQKGFTLSLFCPLF